MLPSEGPSFITWRHRLFLFRMGEERRCVQTRASGSVAGSTYAGALRSLSCSANLELNCVCVTSFGMANESWADRCCSVRLEQLKYCTRSTHGLRQNGVLRRRALSGSCCMPNIVPRESGARNAEGFEVLRVLGVFLSAARSWHTTATPLGARDGQPFRSRPRVGLEGPSAPTPSALLFSAGG